MNRWRLAAACAVASASVGMALAATTFYVATTGTDSASCGTSAAPCRHIQFAVSKAAEGDSVRVKNGTYNECFEVPIFDSGIRKITVESDGFATNGTSGGAILDGAGICDENSVAPGPVAIVYFDSVLRGFKIQHGGDAGVWGFGTVVRSESESARVGERFYGYFPMSSHLIVQPKRADAAGFFDGAAHRRDLGAVYNQYARTTRDPSYHPDTEPQQALLRPLFGTAYFLADYLREYGCFDAEVVLVSSASSKLAAIVASLLAAGAKRDRRKFIGLTSAQHLLFVQQLGSYDRVIGYDEIAALPTARRAVFLDIAGSSAIRAAVHRHLGSALKSSLLVGTTHHDLQPPEAGLPGPEPVPFSVSVWIRHCDQQWTTDVMRRRIGEAWRDLFTTMLDPGHGWLTILQSSGPAAVARVYGDLVSGRARPQDGHVLAL